MAATRGVWAVHCPAVSHGLRPYALSLEGPTTGLFGDPADHGHGALVDAVTSALCFWAMLHLWAPMFPGIVTGEDPHAALAALLNVVNAPLPGALHPDGWLTRNALGPLDGRVASTRAAPSRATPAISVVPHSPAPAHRH